MSKKGGWIPLDKGDDMREIKFRAWEIEGKAWIAGFNMVNYHGYFNAGLKQSIFRYNSDWEDDEYIIEQFTGLKDKNGKEIYEGDLLRCPLDNDCLHQVIFGIKNNCPAFVLEPTDKERIGWPFIINLKSFDVVGNIHENPELLED